MKIMNVRVRLVLLCGLSVYACGGSADEDGPGCPGEGGRGPLGGVAGKHTGGRALGGGGLAGNPGTGGAHTAAGGNDAGQAGSAGSGGIAGGHGTAGAGGAAASSVGKAERVVALDKADRAQPEAVRTPVEVARAQGQRPGALAGKAERGKRYRRRCSSPTTLRTRSIVTQLRRITIRC